jgi:hypothetical protein
MDMNGREGTDEWLDEDEWTRMYCNALVDSLTYHVGGSPTIEDYLQVLSDDESLWTRGRRQWRRRDKTGTEAGEDGVYPLCVGGSLTTYDYIPTGVIDNRTAMNMRSGANCLQDGDEDGNGGRMKIHGYEIGWIASQSQW